MENIQASKKLETLLAIINAKSCKEKMDEIVNTNDTIHNIGYRSFNRSLFKKLIINDSLDDHYILASYFPKEINLNKIKGGSQLRLITGPYKTNPQKKASIIYLAPWVIKEYFNISIESFLGSLCHVLSYLFKTFLAKL